MGPKWENKTLGEQKEEELCKKSEPNIYNILNRVYIDNFNKLPIWNQSFSEINQNNFDTLNKPGVYEMRCLTTDFSYYGHAQNIKTRLQQHLSRLSKNIHDNSFMQEDYNNFGQDSFKCFVISSGNAWTDINIRLAKESELIREKMTIQKCYNHYETLSSKTVSQESRDFIRSALQKPNTKLGKKVRVYNLNTNEYRVYNSVSEAAAYAEDKSLDRGSVRNRINSPKFPDWPWDDESYCNEDFNSKSKSSSSNKPRRCLCNNVEYDSVNEAHRILKLNRGTIKDRLEKNLPDWRWIIKDSDHDNQFY